MNIKIKNKEHKTKFNIFACILLIVLTLYTLSLLGLLFWGLITSLKSTSEFDDISKYQLPQKIVNNYSKLLGWFKVPNTDLVLKFYKGQTGMSTSAVGDMFINSILYALGCGLASTLTCCLTAYACAKYPFKFSKILYTVVIVVMIIPLVGNLPSELEMAMNLGIYKHIYGLWIMKTNFLGMYFLVFYSTFKSFPNSYMEAAKIDGASNWQILTKISMPLVSNVFATILLIYFIQFWNDYQAPLMYMPNYPTISLGLYSITLGGSLDGDGNHIVYTVTASYIVVIPTLILFLVFQKRLLGNLTVGGVKG